ncbi:MAG: bifunctional (p)ppGpp synthetase/guanosine-3',5'-bis(diphosphate) 3'-pyrophosphohydrolase, partial [Clostridia bacterium]|nr:bifunctional (p)ppGpp synthetase/guanosine-3',5'-bis(diphosphate) 3'-pyrophosphohydrolase [Clostridia bacterium]
VPLTYILKTGDVVDIKTNKNTGPSEDWLNIAKTTSALNHIRKYLSKQNVLLNKDEAIARGKELFTMRDREHMQIRAENRWIFHHNALGKSDELLFALGRPWNRMHLPEM